MSPRRRATPVPPAPTTLRLELGDVPLRVKLEEEPTPSWWQRNGSSLLALVVVVVFLLGAFWFVSQRHRRTVNFQPPMDGLTVVLDRPARVAARDQGVLGIEVVNGGAAALPQVQVSVLFSDVLAVSLPITGSNVLDFGSLEPGEGKRRELTIRLERSVPVNFTLRASTGTGQEGTSVVQTVPWFPVPYLGTFLTFVVLGSGSGGLVALAMKEVFSLLTDGRGKQ